MHSKAVIIATGGTQKLYPVRTGPEELTGDGQAMAWRAGASLVDMEMVQFGPNRLLDPPILRGIQFPNQFCRYLDVWLLNRYGERFMRKWDPERMERSTRDIVSIGTMTEVLEGRGSPAGGVYMSANHLPRDLIEHLDEWAMQPHLKKGWIYQGFDFSLIRNRLLQGCALEVGPACHFFMGGVKVDAHCWTGVQGLYAAGEVTGGMNGGNRLSGNAYTQMTVQGAEAGATAAIYAKGLKHGPDPEPYRMGACMARMESPLTRKATVNAFELTERIQEAAWKGIGVIRNGAGLQEFLDVVDSLRLTVSAIGCRSRERLYNLEWVEAMQLENLLTCARSIGLSALLRTESRGAHYRQDFRQRDDETWLGNVVTRPPGSEGEMLVSFVPLPDSARTADKERPS